MSFEIIEDRPTMDKIKDKHSYFGTMNSAQNYSGVPENKPRKIITWQIAIKRHKETTMHKFSKLKVEICGMIKEKLN